MIELLGIVIAWVCFALALGLVYALGRV